MRRLLACTTFVFALAAGAECPEEVAYPRAPDLSALHGMTASYEEMAAAREATRDYMRAVEDYLACNPRAYSVQYDQLRWSVKKTTRAYNLELRDFESRATDRLVIN